MPRASSSRSLAALGMTAGALGMTASALGMTILLASSADAQSNDATAIRRARLEQNRAIAGNNVDRVASFWTEDVILRRGLGQAVIGRDAYRRLFAQAQSDSSLVYQ